MIRGKQITAKCPRPAGVRGSTRARQRQGRAQYNQLMMIEVDDGTLDSRCHFRSSAALRLSSFDEMSVTSQASQAVVRYRQNPGVFTVPTKFFPPQIGELIAGVHTYCGAKLCMNCGATGGLSGEPLTDEHAACRRGCLHYVLKEPSSVSPAEFRGYPLCRLEMLANASLSMITCSARNPLPALSCRVRIRG